MNVTSFQDFKLSDKQISPTFCYFLINNALLYHFLWNTLAPNEKMTETSVFFVKREVLKWRHIHSQCPVFGHAFFYPTGSEIWRFWYIKTRGRKIVIEKKFAMLIIFLSVAHFFKVLPFLSVWPIFKSVTHFSKCDPFFQVWPIFPSATRFYKCDPFFQLWPVFPSVTHFSECDPFFQVWNIFPSVTHFSKCDPFFQVWHPFSKSVLFLQVWPLFPSVTHFYCATVAFNNFCFSC